MRKSTSFVLSIVLMSFLFAGCAVKKEQKEDINSAVHNEAARAVRMK